MSFSVSSSKLTATPGKLSWVQVHEFLPEVGEKLEFRGHLFAVISTQKKEEPGVKIQRELDSISLGREVIARLHEEYFGNLEPTAFAALKSAVSRAISEFSGDLGNIQIAAVALLSNVAYSAAGGGAQVAIFREGMLARILESERKKSSGSKVDVVSASGYPKEADILILGSSSFFETFPGGVLKTSLDGRDIKKTVEDLAPTVHSDKKNATVGAAFITGFKKTPEFNSGDELNADMPSSFRGSSTFKGGEDVVKFEKKKQDTTASSLKLEGERKQKEKNGQLKSFTDRIQATRSLFGRKLDEKLSKLPERRIYIKEGGDEEKVSQKRKVAASIGIILISLLVVSIFFGIRQKRKSEAIEKYEPLLTQAQHEFDEAVGLFSLDEKRARELISLSRSKVDQMLAEGVEDERLSKLKESLDQNQSRILGEYTQEAELYIDLGLLSEGFTGEFIASSEERLFVLDKDGERIIRVFLDTKKSEVVTGPDELDSPKGIAAYSDNTYVVEDKGIFKISGERKQVVDDDLSSDIIAMAYAANLYVLDKDSSLIWRYSAAEEGFSKATSWLTQGVEPDFSSVISWAIDGSIWMLNDKGDILKYSRGNRQNFSVSDVLPDLVNPKKIFTNEDVESLYVLEPERGRVVALTKEGDFIAQYKSEKIRESLGLSVSEKEEKIILVTPDKLYSLEIKHLEE